MSSIMNKSATSGGKTTSFSKDTKSWASKTKGKNDSKAGITGTHNGSRSGGPSTSFKGVGSSSKRSSELNDQMRHHKQSNCHVSLMSVLLLGGMIPFITMTCMAWYVFNNNTLSNIARVYDASQDSLKYLIVEKIDSVIDAEVEAFRTLYEGAVKVVNSGAYLEHAIASYSFDIKKKRTAFWTQTISESYHYRMTYFIFSCHGHIVGTGFDANSSEYVAYYTDPHIFENETTSFTSHAGVVYGDDGCNTADFFGKTSKETTHTKRFTDTNYWKNILDVDYDNHDTTTYEDGRLRSWYIESHKTDDECDWTLPYIVDQTPRDVRAYVSTISMKTYDYSGHEHGLVAIDLSLDRLNTFIQELSVTFPGTSSVVLTNEQRVMAASDGDNVHVFTINGVETSELYTFTDYAEEMKRQKDRKLYLALADYLYANPEYFNSLQEEHFDIGDPDLRPKPAHFDALTLEGRPLVVSALHMTDHCGLDVTLMIMTDEDIFMADIANYEAEVQSQLQIDTIITLSIIPVMGLITLGLLIVVTRGVSVPLKIMQTDVGKVQELDFNGGFDLQKPYVSELSSIARDYAGLKAIMKRFRCFVPPQIIAELVSEGTSGNGTRRIVENRYIATLFCDVANFTKVAHKCDQTVVLEFANKFLGGSADLVVKDGGTVIDFFGDQIFSIFNAPVEDPDFLVKTIHAATKILELFDKAKAFFIKKDPIFKVLDVRIGLHCGSALVGKIGSQERLKYCAIGENVNLGSRLEGINKRYGSRMACSSDFLFSMPRDAKRKYTIRPMEFIRVRRREAPVLIYEIAGLTSSLSREVITEFEEHATMFERVKSKRVSAEELENFIKSRGKNAKFLRSGSMLSDSQL